MSTQNNTAPEVKPAIRRDIVATITPEEIAAAMLRLLAEAQAVNPGITVVEISGVQYTCEDEPRASWSGHGVKSACSINQCDFAGLTSSLSRQIGPSEKAAAELREQARRLIEDAERMEIATAGKETA